MKLDFARRQGVRATSVLLLAIGIGGSVHALWQRQSLLRQRATLALKIEAQTSGRTTYASSAAATPDPMAAREMDKIVAGLRNPWDAALDALHRASKPDVILVRMDTETQGARLRILGHAQSSDAVFDFVQRLREDAFWRRVDLLSEAVREDTTPSTQPIAFQVALEWTRP